MTYYVFLFAFSRITRVWLDFDDNGKTGQKISKTAAAYIQHHNLARHAVPINRRTATISLNNNKTIVAKRNQLPLVSVCAMTIHKSQGGTFDQIVYEYNKKHAQQLLYVALSRVTTIEGLFIVTKTDNDFTFHHGKRAATSMVSLQDEFRRLASSRLHTKQNMLLDFIKNKPGLSIFLYHISIVLYNTNVPMLGLVVLPFITTVKMTHTLLHHTWICVINNQISQQY